MKNIIRRGSIVFTAFVMAWFMALGCSGGGGGGTTTETPPIVTPAPTPGGPATAIGNLAEGDVCGADAQCSEGLKCLSGVCAKLPPADEDKDGVADALDNCPKVANADQSDIDNDTKGDACDEDKDGDGVPNEKDNCPDMLNAAQDDLDNDGIGTICEPKDGKGPNIVLKNCPKPFIKPQTLIMKVESDALQIECRRDNDPKIFGDACKGDVAIESNTEGAHKFYVSGLDAEGEKTIAGCEWVVDATAPVPFTYAATPGWRSITLSQFDPPAASEDANFDYYAAAPTLANNIGTPVSIIPEPITFTAAPITFSYPSVPLYNGISNYGVVAMAVDKAENSSGFIFKEGISLANQFNWHYQRLYDGPVFKEIDSVYDPLNNKIYISYGKMVDQKYVPYLMMIDINDHYAFGEADIQVPLIGCASLIVEDRESLTMAMTKDGAVHIVYPCNETVYPFGRSYLKHSSYQNGTWTSETISVSQGYQSNALFAKNNDLWLMSIKTSGQPPTGIILQKKASGSANWSKEVQLITNAFSSDVSMVANGSLIAFMARQKKVANYVLSAGYCNSAQSDCLDLTKWTFDDIDTGSGPNIDVGKYNAALIDSGGCLHIFYLNYPSKSIMYKTDSNFDGSCANGLKPAVALDVNSTKGPFAVSIDANNAIHYSSICNWDNCSQEDKLNYSLILPKGQDPIFTKMVRSLGAASQVQSEYNIMPINDGALWICHADVLGNPGIVCDIDSPPQAAPVP